MRSYDVEMVPTDNGPWCLKSEVDAVIRHQKYKRCLAMAKWCCLAKQFEDTEWYAKWINKWHNKWHSLAKHYKEMAK